MFNKTRLLPILLALSSSLTYAGNFYLGPSLQYESIQAEDSYQAISPRVTFGYGTPLNDVYGLAGEIFAAAGTIENHPSDSGLKNTPNVGFSILPCVLFGTKSFGFGRLGLITASFSAHDTDVVWGAQAGLGFETPIAHAWDIRAEYVYTAYENVSLEGSPKSSAFVLGFMYNLS
jgi:hypothetical protein